MKFKARIVGVGPFGAGAEFEFHGPGLYVLSGPNGSGKSSLLAALSRAGGGPGSVAVAFDSIRTAEAVGPLAPVEKGTVTLSAGDVEGGITVSLSKAGATTVRPIGQLPVAVADLSAFERLTRPPGIGADKIASEERRALAEILGLEATPSSLLAPWVRQTVEVSLVPVPLLEAAEAARRTANSVALSKEKEASQLAGQIAGLGGVRPARDVAELEREVEAAHREAQRVAIEAARRQSAEKEREALSAVAGERPDVEAARIAVDVCAEAVAGRAQTVRELRAQLDEAERRLAAAQAEQSAAMRALQAAERGAEEYDRRAAVLATPIEGPTPDEAESAAAKARKLAAALDDARRAAQASEVDAQRKRAADLAAQLRAEVSNIDARVGNVLAQAGVTGWGLDADGRVTVIHPQRGIPWPLHGLSAGERDSVALDLLLSRMPASDRPRLLILPQEIGEGLDDERRRRLAQLAQGRGVVIITAEVGSAPLSLSRV